MPSSRTEPMTLDDVKKSVKAALTRKEVAQVLGVDERTVSYAIERQEIPAIKIGRRVLIPREQFIAMFETPGAA